MLTHKELQKVYSWQPYREDWAVDRNKKEDNIEHFYGNLIKSKLLNDVFDSFYSEDGNLGNYLEFFCYPKVQSLYSGNSIQICISLCSPVVAYGQSTVHKTKDSFGLGHMFSAESIGKITDSSLTVMEIELKRLIANYDLVMLTCELAARRLPQEVADEVQEENHNTGNQVLQGIFQKID